MWALLGPLRSATPLHCLVLALGEQMSVNYDSFLSVYLISISSAIF